MQSVFIIFLILFLLWAFASSPFALLLIPFVWVPIACFLVVIGGA